LGARGVAADRVPPLIRFWLGFTAQLDAKIAIAGLRLR
jgi:hypothetical protein